MAERTIDLKAVVGLGNPGPEHSETRHNAGFWFVDELLASVTGSFRADKKFFGDTAKIALGGRELWLLKPQTYMNRSGQAVNSLMAFYRFAPENILVVHDEIDLPPGEVRFKTGGGHGGHNGLRDIINQLGSREFHRLRIGVGHPGHKDDVVDYVLHRPSKDDRVLIDQSIKAALDVMPLLAEGSAERAMHRLHTREKPDGN